MRYNVHSPHAFRNRIAKSMGVLVAAALIATLGLPSAAQAQEIGTVGYDDNNGFTVTWSTRYAIDTSTDDGTDDGINSWVVTFTRPNDEKVSFDQFHADHGALGSDLGTMSGTFDFVGRQDLGGWWVEVGACFVTTNDIDADVIPESCPPADLQTDSEGYTHGTPAAPMNFAANAVPGGVALTWESMLADHAITGYEYAFETKADGKPDWKGIKTAGAEVIDADPGEHTFMLRAIGTSDNDVSTTGAIPGAASSDTVTVPMPSPTLPEIAMLLLAMLLLGSGAYLLRGRQLGGLSQA